MSPTYFLLCLAYTATAVDSSAPSLIMVHSVARNRRLLLDWPRAFGCDAATAMIGASPRMFRIEPWDDPLVAASRWCATEARVAGSTFKSCVADLLGWVKSEMSEGYALRLAGRARRDERESVVGPGMGLGTILPGRAAGFQLPRLVRSPSLQPYTLHSHPRHAPRPFDAWSHTLVIGFALDVSLARRRADVCSSPFVR
jgi:hypothetical protein